MTKKQKQTALFVVIILVAMLADNFDNIFFNF